MGCPGGQHTGDLKAKGLPLDSVPPFQAGEKVGYQVLGFLNGGGGPGSSPLSCPLAG